MRARLLHLARALSWTGFWLAVGVGLRLFHYLRNPSLWHDEAAVVVNVLQKGYADFFGPLLYSEAAPPLFLCVEKAVVTVFGDSLYSFRLFPFLASCGALLVVVACARRIMAERAVSWVAAIAACSDTILWHSCEAKPYAVDLLLSAGLMSLVVFGREWPIQRVLTILCLVSPAMVFLSFPTCFLLGGAAVCLLPVAVRRQCATVWFLYGLFVTVLCGSFLFLLAGPIHAQRDEHMLGCWVHTFPDWRRYWTVPGWMIQRTTEVARYAIQPTGNALIVVLVAGVAVLWREGQRRLAVFLVAPVLLACVAGLARQYPYGPYRVMSFAAPACWILVGVGVLPTLHALRRLTPVAPLALLLLVAIPIAQAGYRVAVPWRRADTASAFAYVRAGWEPGEIVIGNAWEDIYYTRHGDLPYVTCGRLRALDCGGAWVVATSASEAERQAILKHVACFAPWTLLEKRHFERVTVFHLQRNDRFGTESAQAGPLP